jgi:hypothetical protein
MYLGGMKNKNNKKLITQTNITKSILGKKYGTIGMFLSS